MARLYLQLAKNFQGPLFHHALVTLNGAPALLLHDGKTVGSAMWIECEGERITAIHALRHPAKLAHLMPVANAAAANAAVTKLEAGTSLH